MDVVLMRDVHGHGVLVVVTEDHTATSHVETQDAVAVTWTAARLQSSLAGIVGEIMGVRGVGILDTVAVILFHSSTAPTSSHIALHTFSVRESAAAAVVTVRRVGMGLEGQGGTALVPPAQSLVLSYSGGGSSPTTASWSSPRVAALSTHSAPLPWTLSSHFSDVFYTDSAAAQVFMVALTQPGWEGRIDKVMVAPSVFLVHSAAVDTRTPFTERARPYADVVSLAAGDGNIMPVLNVVLRRVWNSVDVDKSVALWAEVASTGVTGQSRTDRTLATRILNRVAVAPQTLFPADHTVSAQAQAASTSGPRVHGGDVVSVAAVLSACGDKRDDDDAVHGSNMTDAAEAAPMDAHAEAGTAVGDADEDEGSNVDVNVFEPMDLFVPVLTGAWRLDNASLSGVGAGLRAHDSSAPRARTFEPLTPTAAIVVRDVADTRPILPTPRPLDPRSSPLISTAERGSGDVRVLETGEQVPNLTLKLPLSLPAAAAAADASAPHCTDGQLSHPEEDVAMDWLAYEYRVKRTMQKDGFIRVAGAALRTGDIATGWIIATVLWAHVSWLVVLTLAAALYWHWQTSASLRRLMTESEARHRSAIGAYYAAWISKDQAASGLEQQLRDLTGQLAALQRNLKLFRLFGTWESICYLHPLIQGLTRLKCITDVDGKHMDVLEERRYLRALDGIANAYKRLWACTAPMEAQDSTMAAERAHRSELAHWALDESRSDSAKLTEAFERWGVRVDSLLDEVNARPLAPEEMTRTLTYEEERQIRVWGDYWGDLKKYNLQSSGLASALELPPPPKSPPASPASSTNNRANSPSDNLPRPFQSPPGSPSSINSRSSSPSDNLPRPFSMRV